MLDLILSWAAKAIAGAIELAIDTILPVFGFDFATFSSTFPFAATAYYIFRRVALSITLIIAVYHLFPFLMSWFGIRSEQLKTTPTKQMGQAVLAVLVIYYGNYIMETIIDIAQLPFTALLESNAAGIFTDDAPLITGITETVFAAISDIFYQQSILLYVIMIVMIGWSLIKVILEAIERYVVLYVLVYLSPLAAASLASEETSGIYKRFFSMFVSQCLLLLLNVWSLKMALSMLNNLSALSTPILGLLMGYAFLRVAQKLDSYMNQLGLNAAITGAGLGNELFATGAMLLGKFSGLTGGRTAATSGAGGGGGILGFSQKVSQSFGTYNPGSAGADYARATVAGVRQTLDESAAVGADAYYGTSGTVAERISAAKKARADYNVARKDKNVQAKVNSVDNILTRTENDYFQQNDSAIQAMSQPQSSKEQKEAARDLVSVNAYSAGKVFDSFRQNNYTTNETNDVTSVLEGIGAAKADPTLAQFVNVGYDNTNARNVKYEMNQEGIRASFTLDGREQNLHVMNQAQYNSLDHSKQIAYQNFRSSSGQVYYYKASSEKIASSGKPKSASDKAGANTNPPKSK